MTHSWTLRYASHLGYLSPDQPLFRESVASSDPWEHVAFAAAQGFAGVLYPWATSRPDDEVARFGAALAHFGLKSGCIVFAPLEAILTPLWVQSGESAWAAIDAHLDRSIPLAQTLGASVLAVLIRGQEDLDRRAQEEAAIAHLRRAGDRAAAAGLVVGIEPMVALPGMLLTTTAQAVDLIERTAHPAVKLIFDTGHAQVMDGDVLAAYRLARKHIGLIQLADMPERVEPGAGTIDFSALLSEAKRDGLAGGLIELEHGWSEASAATEQAGIEALRKIDAGLQT
jgi:hydroxypyruvate isomerase